MFFSLGSIKGHHLSTSSSLNYRTEQFKHVSAMNRNTFTKQSQPNLSGSFRSDSETHSDSHEPTLYTVKGIAILDNDGNRILAKYYDSNKFATSKEQKAFEKSLFNKTHRANTEIIIHEGLICVYKSNVDLFFYVMGSAHENELILMSVLNCLYDTVNHLLRKNVEKRIVMENLDTIMLAVDEICDGGIILDADPTNIVQRVALRTDDIPLGEQTVAQVLQSAKEQLKWSLLK